MTARWRRISIHTRLTLWYTGALLTILIVTSALSYSVLRWNLLQDVDRSLYTVAEVIRDARFSTKGETTGASPEATVREILGRDVSDEFFQLVSPRGELGYRSSHLRTQVLPLSREARANAVRGRTTFETIELAEQPVRLVTLPVLDRRHLAQIVQVGISLRKSQRTLRRYLETVLILVPIGVALAAVGGAVMARATLRPVDEMARTARRITAEALSRRIDVRGTGDELDALAETLNGMLARLEGAFGEMRRFSADAAHELRTPLTALKGSLEVALRAKRSPDEYRSVLAANLEEVERLIRLAEGLLQLSRASVGLDATRTDVDVESLVVETLDAGTRLARGTGVSVRLKSVAPAIVRGDPTALRRALLNLVENAIKYTPAGGRVEIAADRDNGHVVLAVDDTGIGIPPAETERIFAPFVRLDAARERSDTGAGLGLAIARSIVTSHGGTLSVESAPGRGSRFSIRLPARGSARSA